MAALAAVVVVEIEPETAENHQWFAMVNGVKVDPFAVVDAGSPAMATPVLVRVLSGVRRDLVWKEHVFSVPLRADHLVTVDVYDRDRDDVARRSGCATLLYVTEKGHESMAALMDMDYARENKEIH